MKHVNIVKETNKTQIFFLYFHNYTRGMLKAKYISFQLYLYT